MAPTPDTIRLQQLKKSLTDQINAKRASSSIFIHQLQFLHQQLLQNNIMGVKNVTDKDLQAYMMKIKKLSEQQQFLAMASQGQNMFPGNPLGAHAFFDKDIFEDLFNAFVDMHVEHMNISLKMSQGTDHFALERLVDSLENSDKELLENWNELTLEYLSICETTLKARSRQRHLAEELQDKYDKKGGVVEKLRKDLIIKERRHRKQYRTQFEQFETLHKSYEEERLNVSQSFFENRRFAKSLVVNSMKQYCEQQEKILERFQNNLKHTKATIERFESIEPQFEAEEELRPTTDLLTYDPLIPTYDKKGEANDVRGEEHTKSSSKLNTFLHFLRKSNPGYFHSAMDSDQLSDLQILNTPSKPKPTGKSSTPKSGQSSSGNHDIHKNNDSNEELDEEDELSDFEIRGSHYFQNYERSEDTDWFESFIDRIMLNSGSSANSPSSPSSASSGSHAKKKADTNCDSSTSNTQNMTINTFTPSGSSTTAAKRQIPSSPLSRISSSSSTTSSPDMQQAEQEAIRKIGTTEGRMAFAMAMNFKRRNPQLNAVAFNILCHLIDRSMTLSYEHNDPNVGRLLLNMTQTFYRLERSTDSFAPPQKIYLQSKLKEHPVWKEMRFWEGSFYDALSAERVKQMSNQKWKNMGEEQRDQAIIHHQNMVFGMLGTFAFSMLNLGLSEELVRSFVQKMCSINSLNSELANIIEENVEETAIALQQSNFRASMRRRSRISSSPIQLKQGFARTPSTPGSPQTGGDGNDASVDIRHVYPPHQKSSLSQTSSNTNEPSLP